MKTKLEMAAAPPVYDTIPLGVVGGRNVSMYGHPAAYFHVLDNEMERLGKLSKWNMARLLGVTDMSNFNKWFTGRRRMSSVYLLRLMKLRDFHDAGIQFALIRGIDWGEPVTICWRNGSKSYPDSLSGRWDETPTPDNPTEDAGVERQRKPAPSKTSFKRRPNFTVGVSISPN